jgi:hypothetical protein
MKRKGIQATFSLALGAACTASAAAPFKGSATAQEVLPMLPAPFMGQIGLSVKNLRPDFPKPTGSKEKK